MGDRLSRRAQAEGMAATGVDVHLGRYLGVLQRQEIGHRVAYIIDRIVLGLDDQGRRRARIGRRRMRQAQIVVVRRPQVPGIERHGEVGAKILAVGGIDGRVGAHAVGADVGDQMPAGRKAQYADLVRIDMQGLGLVTQDRDRALGVLQGHGHGRRLLAVAGVVPVRPTVRHAVFQHDAGHPLGGGPIADLGAFQVDGQDLVAAPREHHHRSPRIAPPGGIDREGRPGDIVDLGHAFRVHLARADLDDLIAGDIGPGYGRIGRPHRHLDDARRRLPRLGLHRAGGEHRDANP